MVIGACVSAVPGGGMAVGRVRHWRVVRWAQYEDDEIVPLWLSKVGPYHNPQVPARRGAEQRGAGEL